MAARTQSKIGLNAAWCMAVGGMIGGGIFSVLGVVYQVAGRFAWLSFLIGGAIALATGHSYARLDRRCPSPGGAYAFLREAGFLRSGSVLAVLLILGYALTLSVYAYAFGAYVSFAFDAPPIVRPVLSSAVLLVIGAVNLVGVGEASALEIVTVWGKLAVLALIAAIGLVHWNPPALSPETFDAGWSAPLIAAGVIFMAYEGFQLLTYDSDDIDDADSVVPKAILLAIASVILIYVAIALGSAMLVGAQAIIDHEEVALAEAGRAALGSFGLWLTVFAAAFSTSSAINATIFSTARLSRRVAGDGEIPGVFGRANGRGLPWVAVTVLTGAAIALTLIGSLAGLVEAASLLFLITFTTVNVLAFASKVRPRWIAIAGGIGAAAASLTLFVRSLHQHPLELAGLALLVAAVASARWWARR